MCWLTIGHLFKKVNKPARNLRVSAMEDTRLVQSSAAGARGRMYNNNNSYIDQYPVKNYEHAVLYIINIKIHLTVKEV